MTGPNTVERNSPRVALATLMAVIVAILAIAAVAFTTVLIVNASRPDPFDPFQLPDQPVLSRVPGTAGPATTYGGDLIVQGTKCNLSGHTVSLTSVSVWASEVPPGTVIPDARGLGALPPGCTTTRFVNPVTPELEGADRRLRASGVRHPLWRLTAELTPQGKDVVARSWRTEPFELVPR